MPDSPDDKVRTEPLRLTLPLTPATVEWLAALTQGCDRAAGRMIAEMLEEIRLDDEAAHSTLH